MIYFTHIPKCGGQSFKEGLKETYGDQAHYLNLIPTPIFLWPKIQLFLWRQKSRFFPPTIPLGKKIVFGHFCFDDLPGSNGSDAKRGAFFRDPIEWFGSYYFYNHDKYPNQIPTDPIKFIKESGLADGFRKYLGNVEVEDLEFVGLQEDYAASLALYERVFAKKIPAILKNATKSKQKVTGESNTYREYFKKSGQLAQIESAIKDNFAIYEAAVRRHNDLMEKHGLQHEARGQPFDPKFNSANPR